MPDEPVIIGFVYLKESFTEQRRGVVTMTLASSYALLLYFTNECKSPHKIAR